MPSLRVQAQESLDSAALNVICEIDERQVNRLRGIRSVWTDRGTDRLTLACLFDGCGARARRLVAGNTQTLVSNWMWFSAREPQGRGHSREEDKNHAAVTWHRG